MTGAEGQMARIAVLGGGSWGTALAIHLARSGRPCRLWFRDPDRAREVRESRINSRYLPQWSIPDDVRIEANMGRCLEGIEVGVIAVPSSALPELAVWLAALHRPRDILWACATKGIVGDAGLRCSEILLDQLGETSRLVVLAGPSLALEVLQGLPTAVVAASTDSEQAARVQALFHGESFRVYTSRDVVGVEIGVSLKNTLAIAAGLAQELALGHNGYGALLTRGLAEISRLGVAVGARRETFLGLAGLGDLVTTCSSPLSRNHQLGRRLARGESLDTALANLGSVAEGVPTTRSALALAKRAGAEMPITAQVGEILFEGKDPREALQDLMLRPPREEGEGA
jgi:glycerol-3-phosphate dehydrogenase (NAD(P)+)